MANILQKIIDKKKNAILFEYFEISEDAAKYRDREITAAIKIQKKWKGFNTRNIYREMEHSVIVIQKTFRGYLGRKRYGLIVEKINSEISDNYYNSNARLIQRCWRGYYSRSRKFDYHGRKRYLENLEEKMDNLRKSLVKHALDQKQAEILHKQERHLNLVSKLAGKRHHLLGTFSNPGVYSLPPRDKRPPTEEALGLQHTIIKIPESQIRNNDTLKKWIADNIKNSKRFLVKSHRTSEEESGEKLVQGPFLPKYYLCKKIKLPFKPTLRVQTNYYDTQDYKREEKRQEVIQRCTDKYFSTASFLHTPKEYFLKSDPYQIPKYGRLYFRESDATKNISKKDFKLILGQKETFEELEPLNL